jgi:DNA repair protein RecN (Recombination protein N)
MIGFLHVRNLATIEDLELRFGTGFSVLTGETGAGKSMIIDSIRLICGEKASSGMIRTGQKEAVVEAVFTTPDGGELVVQRVVSEDGAGRAYGDGVLVPVKRLRELGGDLIDIYGQNDHIFLLRLDSHRDYLDQYAGAASLRAETASLAQRLRALVQQRNDWRTRERERRQRLDYLEFQIQEIEKAGLREGEEDDLRAQRHILRNAEKIRQLLDAAITVSYNEEPSFSGLASRLQALLGELAAFDPTFGELRDGLDQAVIAARETADFLVHYKDTRDDGPERLESIEERLSQIESLKRKYGGPVEDIQVYLGRLRQERDDLTCIQEKLAEADAATAALLSEYEAKAKALSAARRAAAGELEGQIEKEIGLLGMKKARFHVHVEPRPLDMNGAEDVRDFGLDDVEFLISPNPGEDLKPLRKIASGGELSRIMLALKAVSKEKGTIRTLIFDEIDAGIGGKTADFVAQKLRSLARAHQVICITHLPQIASFADHHYRIAKRVTNDRTFTTVEKLAPEARVEEIARLMAGSRVTELSRESAREMLEHHQKE